MPLYVIRPPNPAAGVDWLATVPGQYLYDITGITATLTTAAGGATVAHDSSGNGRDGTYHGGNTTGWFVPGIVPGDASFLTGDLFSGNKFWLSSPAAVMQWTAPWSFACWIEIGVVAPTSIQILCNCLGPLAVSYLRIHLLAANNGSLRVNSPTGTWRTANGVIPTNGAACFVAVTWDGVTLIPYVNGVAVAWAAVSPAPGPSPVLDPPIFASGNGVVSNTEINADEWTVWDTTIAAGDVAAIYAAASVSFAAYTAAVLATTPAIYYHLNDGALGVGRQVTLAVTDGTTTVEQIPSGFPVAGALGSYAYSWQPGLGASAQTVDGATTTVAIPRLILPAGYTVGARTLDLGGADQWSDVVIWWDSTLMDSINHLYDYQFAPGWKIDYHYDPAATSG